MFDDRLNGSVVTLRDDVVVGVSFGFRHCILQHHISRHPDLDLFAEFFAGLVPLSRNLLLQGRGVVRGAKSNVAVLCRKFPAPWGTACVEQHGSRLHTVRLAECCFQIEVLSRVIETFPA